MSRELPTPETLTSRRAELDDSHHVESGDKLSCQISDCTMLSWHEQDGMIAAGGSYRQAHVRVSI